MDNYEAFGNSWISKHQWLQQLLPALPVQFWIWAKPFPPSFSFAIFNIYLQLIFQKILHLFLPSFLPFDSFFLVLFHQHCLAGTSGFLFWPPKKHPLEGHSRKFSQALVENSKIPGQSQFLLSLRSVLQGRLIVEAMHQLRGYYIVILWLLWKEYLPHSSKYSNLTFSA